MHCYYTKGFTLLELLIAITIIGILVAVAVPSYQSYTRRAHYTEVVQAAAPYKLGVEECYQMTADLSTCQSGQNGVPIDVALGQGAGIIDSITTSSGKITLTPRDKFGIKADDTYILTPTVSTDRLTWASSGGAVSKGYAN
ncbi:MAG: prepilin-type N-terminal cleavage/methylation domain-containing protein [Gammaproteobacteria bacterium]